MACDCRWDRIQARMRVTVSTAFNPGADNLTHLAPSKHRSWGLTFGLQPTACAPYTRRRDVERGAKAVTVERRKGVLMEVRVAVVEGNHHRLGRKRIVASRSGGHELCDGDRRVVILGEIRQVLLKPLGRYSPLSESRPGTARNAVVHEDWDGGVLHRRPSLQSTSRAGVRVSLLA